jgi:hypothetical protein
MVAILLCAGCGTTPPKDFGGRWKPVNNFSSQPTEIPLYTAYVFQASPLDGTLKAMLQRWASDNGLQLDYRLQSDYTLHVHVAGINTTSVQQAVSQLSQAYSAQSLQVSLSGNQLVVAIAGADASGV